MSRFWVWLDQRVLRCRWQWVCDRHNDTIVRHYR